VNGVRLFPARVVRQERARWTVTALSDSVDESGIDLMGVAIDRAAYEESPVALYVYRQRRGDASFIGVVCEVAVQAIADGQVRGHEAVHQTRVDALVWHHARSNGPPALVTLLHHAGPAYTRAVEATCKTGPLLDFDGPGGLQQTVWRVPDGLTTRAVLQELGAADLYIADGHHRVAAALEEWGAAGKPADAGVLCVIHPMDGLALSAFHRRVTGPVRPAELIALLTPAFLLREVPAAPTPVPGSMGLYVDHRWYEATYQEARPSGPAGLDVTILQSRVLGRLVQQRPGPVYTVEVAPAPTSIEELTERCDADGGALFTLAPPALDTLTELADAGQVMPPKTTYFEPKPCIGIFLRP
jgi:uncharacterized protein (DUF1015 family)